MRYVCLLISMLPAVLSAQDGAAIYKERCASCHDAPQERVPSIAAIKAMSGEAIYLALTNGAMKSRAEGLSITQIFALIGYIAPTGGTQPTASFEPTCKGGAAFLTSMERLEHESHKLALPGCGFGAPRRIGYPQAKAEVGVQSRKRNRRAIPAHSGRRPRVHRYRDGSLVRT
jgi:cytochrome c553